MAFKAELDIGERARIFTYELSVRKAQTLLPGRLQLFGLTWAWTLGRELFLGRRWAFGHGKQD